jgi:hypothetical protein
MKKPLAGDPARGKLAYGRLLDFPDTVWIVLMFLNGSLNGAFRRIGGNLISCRVSNCVNHGIHPLNPFNFAFAVVYGMKLNGVLKDTCPSLVVKVNGKNVKATIVKAWVLQDTQDVKSHGISRPFLRYKSNAPTAGKALSRYIKNVIGCDRPVWSIETYSA